MKVSSMCLRDSSGKELRFTRYSAASLRAVTSATGEALTGNNPLYRVSLAWRKHLIMFHRMSSGRRSGRRWTNQK